MSVVRLLVAAALLVGASACTGSDPAARGPDAQAAAEALATALSERSLAGVPVDAPEADAELADIVAGLGERELEVRAGEVRTEETDGGPATSRIPLTWSWQIGGEPWTYQTTARMRVVDGAWQVQWEPSLVEPSLTAGERLDVATIPARRGDILGAGGAVLVTERDVIRYGIDKTKVPAARAPASARALARRLGVDVTAYVERVRAAGDRAFVEALVLRAEEGRRTLDPNDLGIPGAVALGDTRPLAPTKEFAAPLLGVVGPATAEVIEESGGAVDAGDLVGLSGLQRRYDEQLRGQDGLEVRAEAPDGMIRALTERPAVDGQPLRLSLDAALQARAERTLAGIGGDNASALVAIRPSTGDVLAAASGPGSGGLTVATFGQYPPGSTFKVVTSLALLRSGLSPASPLTCATSVVVDGKRFENYSDFPPEAVGRITLRRALALSCNTAFIGARSRIDDGDLAAAAAALGLGVDHDVGFPAYFGQVPPAESETEAAADLIGQGRVLASPLTMATVAASVTAGRPVLPRLVLDGEVAQTPPGKPLTAREAAALRSMMGSVVTDGSGRGLAGLATGAKTGTAEYGEPGPGGRLPTHAWMIAFRGDLAVAAFVETGESGSKTAGPLLAALLRR